MKNLPIPEKIDTFSSTKDKIFSFTSCDTCNAKCCSGAGGSTYTPIVLEDFTQVYKNFPILFSFGSKGYPKANILLNNGHDYCPYIKDNKCAIYEDRPSICRAFPLSPSIFDNVYISEECPSVSLLEKENSETIISNGEIKNKSFEYEIFNDYSDKFLKTHHHFLDFIEDGAFKSIVEINDVLFYVYNKQSDDKFMKLHYKSLDNLENIRIIQQ